MQHEVFHPSIARICANLLHLAIQGIGGGGILNLSDIITSDLVPLSERGMFEGLLGLTWAFASGIGPPIVPGSLLFSVLLLISHFQGGALAQKVSWRWIFCQRFARPTFPNLIIL